MKLIKHYSLFFWGSWFSVVCLTNLCDVLKLWHFLPKDWLWFSGNWELVRHLFETQHWSFKLAGALFGIIISWELLIVVSFFYSFYVFSKRKDNSINTINRAFAIALSFWAAFLLGDEILLAYVQESQHIILASLMLLNALLFYIKEGELYD